MEDVKKFILLQGWAITDFGLSVIYCRKDGMNTLFVQRSDVNEYLLEVLGEDIETATEATGFLSQYDAMRLAVAYEEERATKIRATAWVDDLLGTIKNIGK